MKTCMFKRFFLTLSIAVSLFAFNASASFDTGTIDASFSKTKVCKDVLCASSSLVNFRPIGVNQIIIDDTDGINGIAWGTELSWITFHPSGNPAVSINPSTGALSGKAWSGGSSWINFRPANADTVSLGLPVGVSITSDGEFYGWAWVSGPNGGWLKFDCTSPDTCVKTDWRPLSERTTSSSGGGTVDMCPNIAGIQPTIPPGYVISTGAICTSVASQDLCVNVPGVQEAVPEGYLANDMQFCFVSTLDFCRNIPNVQYVVPEGYTVAEDGRCLLLLSEFVPIPQIPDQDRCLNISGVQVSVPTGFLEDKFKNCQPESVDMCPNISQSQVNIPEGMMIDRLGDCVVVVDVTQQGPSVGLKQSILKYRFIPKSIEIPVDMPFVARMFTDTNSQARPYVDLVSVILTVLLACSLLSLWWLLVFSKSGIVYDAASRKLLSGVTIELSKEGTSMVKRVTTDDRGRYRIFVGPGTYILKVDTDGYDFPSHSVHDVVRLQNGETVKNNYYSRQVSVMLPGLLRADIPLDPQI